MTAIRLNQLLIFSQRVNCTLIDTVGHQRTVIHVQRDLIACRQQSCALISDDYSLITYFRCQQRYITTRRDIDRTLIHHRTLRLPGRTAKRELARHQIRIRQIQGRSNQTTHIHLRTRTEQHTVRIQHEHITVCAQATQDHTRILTGHAIERDRAGVRLIEAHCLIGGNTEILPVDGQILTRLRDCRV